jgi:hypothetical protein
MKESKMRTSLSLFALIVAMPLVAGPSWAEELNALVWCDHTDDALIQPFEEKFDVTVNLKEYEGTGAALSIIEQSQPGDWDVLVIDGIDVPRAVTAGILAPLPEDALPYATIFPELIMEESQKIDGKIYAVSEKFGYNTVSFNSSAVTAEDLADMTRLWSGDFEGRLAVYDYYLPVMGMVAVHPRPDRGGDRVLRHAVVRPVADEMVQGGDDLLRERAVLFLEPERVRPEGVRRGFGVGPEVLRAYRRRWRRAVVGPDALRLREVGRIV